MYILVIHCTFDNISKICRYRIMAFVKLSHKYMQKFHRYLIFYWINKIGKTEKSIKSM